MKRDNHSFKPAGGKLYLAFFKPYGYLCQFTQPPDSAKPTLAAFGFPVNVYPVGRLDWDSEGLLLLTDDGSLNFALLNPQRRHPRTYLAQVENIPPASALRKLESGIMLDGKKTMPAKAQLLNEEPALPPRAVPIRERRNIPVAWIQLTLTEGRNRQVRRMTAAVGHPTLRLVRTAIGALQLADLGLDPANWRELSSDELRLLFL